MLQQLLTDEYWNEFKAIMLSLDNYDKPTLMACTQVNSNNSYSK